MDAHVFTLLRPFAQRVEELGQMVGVIAHPSNPTPTTQGLKRGLTYAVEEVKMKKAALQGGMGVTGGVCQLSVRAKQSCGGKAGRNGGMLLQWVWR